MGAVLTVATLILVAAIMRWIHPIDPGPDDPAEPWTTSWLVIWGNHLLCRHPLIAPVGLLLASLLGLAPGELRKGWVFLLAAAATLVLCCFIH